MLTKKTILRAAGASLAAFISLAVQPIKAQTSSESKAIEELKREVAELKQEVSSLKKHAAPTPVAAGEGPTKRK
jgi:cell division protein FtsB